MAYRYRRHANPEYSVARSADAVTPNDSTDLTNVAKALWVGGGGTVVVDTFGGSSSIAFTNVQGILPVAVRRVRATGTTATNIVALY